tara:strand:+ start:167 stop:1297 length:1131 start_codon:yes stop_codon:yes gene_type:complete
MLQNKIYQNFIKEIIKTFIVILFGLTIIAWTVRAVNFLDLIVDSGYSVKTYFIYSILNFFSILTKFIPLSFLISLMIFIIKQIQENEFIILWTSGVKKLQLVNLFFITSIGILFFHIIFSTFISPLTLNKSRILLNENGYNSFLPTVRVNQFSDSFQGFTFIVEEKFQDQIKNVFIHDSANTLKNLTANNPNTKSTTIVAQEGILEEKKMVLFNGKIITSEEENKKNKIIKFEQLNIDLKNLNPGTIKQTKLQETSSIKLINCFFKLNEEIINCNANAKKEIITILNRRIILPFYIPVIALICSFLLIKTHKKNYFINKYSIFVISFIILLYAELIIRYTGISSLARLIFICSPAILTPIIYFTLILKFKKESLLK